MLNVQVLFPSAVYVKSCSSFSFIFRMWKKQFCQNNMNIYYANIQEAYSELLSLKLVIFWCALCKQALSRMLGSWSKRLGNNSFFPQTPLKQALSEFLRVWFKQSFQTLKAFMLFSLLPSSYVCADQGRIIKMHVHMHWVQIHSLSPQVLL